MRKIIILTVFLVAFLTNKAQVNPETFPTVTPLATDNVYSQTGGVTKKFTLKSILDLQDGIDTISITYADFYNAITNSQLVGGMTYVITDFQTIYDQMDFDASGALKPTLVTKTGAIEQIWVLALSSNQIADRAYSRTYPKDEIQYDWTYNTTLVNGAPAKGRISERIDEWNNRTDYDHREIKFIRYDDGNGNFVQINDSGRTSQEFLTFGNSYGGGGDIYNNYLGDFYSIGQFFGQEYGNNVFNTSLLIYTTTSSLFRNNTFVNGKVFSNVFSGDINSNIFLRDVGSNTFSGDISSNLFGGKVGSNLFSGKVYYNTFSGDVNTNTFSGDINSNLFEGDIRLNTFSGTINANTFTYTTILSYLNIVAYLTGKIIDDTTYPFLFGTDYEKKILKASNGDIYIRYFDGTNDVNTLIP